MQQELLPLFPLQTVLLPGNIIALHIFEDRYKEMIGQAIRDSSEFGIVLASEKGIVNTGCTAVVDRVVREYEDGRMDILGIGRRRFEIQSLDDERTYLRGAVEFFDDDVDEAPSEKSRARAFDLYRELADMDPNPLRVAPDAASAQASFQLAEVVTDLNFRQVLLATRSEAERIRQLVEYLPGFVEQQRDLNHMKSVASTNGHGRWPARLQ
jgi:Lon protease-like protein